MPRDGVLKPREQLDPRERRFVELFVETSNATRSALAAGYGRNYQNAGVYANRLLKKARIKDAVDRRNAELMARLYPAERTELTGADGEPIQTANLNATVHKIDIASLEPEQRDQLRQVLL